MTTPEVELNNGVRIPAIGFGVYQVPPDDTERVVSDALEVTCPTSIRTALVDLIDHNDVTPAVNQIETHPYFQRLADHDVMRERGVQIESWGPFAEGRNDLFTDPTLAAIGEAHGKSVAQVVLRWLIQRDVLVIPKSVRRERMAENFDVFDFTLTDDEIADIAGLDTGESRFFDHRDPAMASQLGTARID